MARMKAVQVSKPGGDFELVEREIPEPGKGQVRIKVEACGICHSDALVKEGLWPGLKYPRIPGHEIAGRIDALGADVTHWQPSDSGSVWDGTAVIVSFATSADAVISCSVSTRRSLQFTSMAAMPST